MKLIKDATECGYRKRLRKNQYPTWIVRACCTKLPFQQHNLPYPCVIVHEPFPEHCPLQDGITMKEHLDSVLELDKKMKSKLTLKQSIKLPYSCDNCETKDGNFCMNVCPLNLEK
jgi:hypothetical protein